MQFIYCLHIEGFYLGFEVLHQSLYSFIGVLQGEKPVKLMFKINRKFMRGFVLLGHNGTQIDDELTVILILKQLLLVHFLSVGGCSLISCVKELKMRKIYI